MDLARCVVSVRLNIRAGDENQIGLESSRFV